MRRPAWATMQLHPTAEVLATLQRMCLVTEGLHDDAGLTMGIGHDRCNLAVAVREHLLELVVRQIRSDPATLNGEHPVLAYPRGQPRGDERGDLVLVEQRRHVEVDLGQLPAADENANPRPAVQFEVTLMNDVVARLRQATASADRRGRPCRAARTTFSQIQAVNRCSLSSISGIERSEARAALRLVTKSSGSP